METKRYIKQLAVGSCLMATLAIGLPNAVAADQHGSQDCSRLPSHAALKAALQAVVAAGNNGGLGNDMWGTVVNRDGVVCAVVFTGANRGSQWLGSRVISAQKANTANAFSRPSGVIGFAGALSTANLWAATQPGGSLFALPHSNPVDAEVAYQGSPAKFGQPNDPLVGEKVGGVNVFGGGLALYNSTGSFVGGLGVSGDTSCTDHIVAWKVRHALNLDNVPAGVGLGTSYDNIILFAVPGTLQSAFTHPTCSPVGADPAPIANNLPTSHPIGPNP